MENFTLNGEKINTGIPQEEKFELLLRYIYSNLPGPNRVVSGIRVNGVEISEEDETALSSVTISDLSSVDVITKDAKEVTEETLQSLRELLQQMVPLCVSCNSLPELRRILDGLEMMIESIAHVKSAMKVEKIDFLEPRENELLALLRELFTTMSPDQPEARKEIMSQKLPVHLLGWVEETLPRLIRYRDS